MLSTARKGRLKNVNIRDAPETINYADWFVACAAITFN